MFKTPLLWLIALLLFASCGDNIEFEYSDHHCYLTIDNSTHLDGTLASSMNQMSPGVFTIIKPVYRNGANFFSFTNNQGLSSEKRFTAIDLRLESYRHVGMQQGLIVGYGNLDQPARFYAFDLQCPNCFDFNALPLKPYELTMNGAGVASCGKCGRNYNMNTGGNILSGGEGKPLTRYRAISRGPYGVLNVN